MLSIFYATMKKRTNIMVLSSCGNSELMREISTRLISSKKQERIDQWVVRSRGRSDS
jgi:hypothetical protein